MFDTPIISTNLKYIKEVKKHLKYNKIKNYRIIAEPEKKNTGPAILSASLINDIPDEQPLLFLSSDHLIEKEYNFLKEIKKHKKYLNNTLNYNDIFIFIMKNIFNITIYCFLIFFIR